MRTLSLTTALLLTLGIAAMSATATATATAQPPGGPGDFGGPPPGPETFFDQMFAYDANKDGKLTKEEVTDPRLTRLFDRADANKDGTVTKAELAALAEQDQAKDQGGPGGGFGGRGGPGGPGGRGGRMMGMFPRPGEVLAGMFRQRLNLTPEQAKQVDELQKEVDGKLARILNDSQQKQLEQMKRQGPGGFGPPGGRGGPGGSPPPPPLN